MAGVPNHPVPPDTTARLRPHSAVSRPEPREGPTTPAASRPAPRTEARRLTASPERLESTDPTPVQEQVARTPPVPAAAGIPWPKALVAKANYSQ